jgi:hypothetical protein
MDYEVNASMDYAKDEPTNGRVKKPAVGGL